MPRRLPPLNALKAFEAAARHESFTRAADELCVTQGAVSHQVKALEAELGLKLFNRQRQRLVITESGRSYLAIVRDAFDRIADGTEELLRRQNSGVLTVSTSPNFAAKWLVHRRFPFKGGVVLEADWNGNVLWEVRHPDHHHHGILLRNENVLLHCMGQVPEEIARRVKGGMVEKDMQSGQYAPLSKAEAGKMYSDYIAEVTRAGETVWEWRTWEHLDPEADGISEIQAPRTMWAQGNSVQELPDGDILASFRPTSTVVRIARKTGQIVWKLGPPMVAGQHAPTLLANGNILIFDNGTHRLDDSMPYSRAIEVNPATNEVVWKYQDAPAWNFFSPRMGIAQRLANGNTLLTESSFGRFFEVTREGEIVWEYVNPFFGGPFFGGPAHSQTNQVFRALRYSPEEIARARGA
jgi:uncharacterized protein (UPF0248 family)